ncbi:alpha/beta hydrolase [Streptomyces durmitorensis]|uniref:Alpha/beta hydrolase n=1 Tax=Streptomyces durmitorensis TaxID=319947 RepID=A0ABY4PKD4_9ACTN|nr:alpha/beta hydrolase [Streptomyces durmitorensis]UQT54165.1 alpha/beta hydrolase [Streptomyces durmitorensis]
MQRRPLVPLLAVTVMAALAPGLAAAPATATPLTRTAPDVATADALRPYTQQKPVWEGCGADIPAALRCATLKVPLDYRDPGGKKIDIAISRLRTSAPGKRHGVLLSNPGGPGGPGLDMPLQLEEQLPQKVKDRYDLIGFDPRGIGRSTPVRCGLSADENVLLRPLRTFDKNVAWAKSVADKCRTKAGDTLPHITTRNTARDMDVLRAVLGERRISYYGGSYGTALGAVYTQMFPRRADRFVLDSAVDPQQMWRGMFRTWAPQAERAFQRWTKWTAARDATYGLGDTPAAVSKSFWDVIAKADRDPIVVDGVPLDGAGVRELVRPEFYTVRAAAERVVKLKEAAEERTKGPAPAEEPPSEFDISAAVAVLCGDSSWPRDPETYRRDSVRDADRYPLYGDFASGVVPCAFWDRPVEPVTEVNNKVPALIVQNEWDSQTPLVAAQVMHRQLKGSRMVTVDEGEGHGVYSTNPCADSAVDSYLATGRLPAADVTCEATPGERRASSSLPAPGPLR